MSVILPEKEVVVEFKLYDEVAWKSGMISGTIVAFHSPTVVSVRVPFLHQIDIITTTTDKLKFIRHYNPKDVGDV